MPRDSDIWHTQCVFFQRHGVAWAYHKVTTPLPTSQQFICIRCRSLVNVQTFEKTHDGIYFCLCSACNAKNAVVQTGATPSMPGILPVTGLID